MKDESGQKPRATLDIKTNKGVSVLVTITHGMTFKELTELFELIDQAGTECENFGFEPNIRYNGATGGKPSFPVKEKNWTGEKCPKDGGRLYKIETKSGKTMVKCEHSKFDFMTKVASGCDYVEWPKEY